MLINRVVPVMVSLHSPREDATDIDVIVIVIIVAVTRTGERAELKVADIDDNAGGRSGPS
jgi:hypothetical protein